MAPTGERVRTSSTWRPALGRIAPEVQLTLLVFGMRARRSELPTVASPSTRVRMIRIPNGICGRLLSKPSVNRWARSVSWGFDLAHETGFQHFPFGPRVVFTLHDLVFARLPEHYPKHADELAHFRLAAKRAKVVMTDSESTRRDAIEYLGLNPERTRAVLLGAPPVSPPRTRLEQIDDRSRLQAFGIRSPYILSLGDILGRKNNVTVVRALADLPPSMRRDLQFVVAGLPGDPRIATELRSEANRLGVARDLLLTGFVDNADRDALLTNAAALVFPSLYEGFGLPILEAMAKGVPVVAANNSSIPEVAGGAALLVDSYRHPAAWAHAISKALCDETWRSEAIVAGLAQVNVLTWERTARSTLESYHLATTL